MAVEEHLRLAALRTGVRSERDVVSDYAEEVAQLHGLPRDEVQRRFRRFLDVYHRRSVEATPEEWAQIRGGEVEHSFIRVSKPYRFRNQDVVPGVLAAIRRHLETGATRPRVLDFGGGFGNDAIVFARSGYEAHYSDLLTLKNADVVRRRFELRDLDIPMHNAHGLPDIRFDVISAVDVLEHIYDVEDAAARLAARIPAGGLFACANAFGAIAYNGDHHDKNRVYVDLFPKLMRAIGFTLVAEDQPLEVFRRDAEPLPDVEQEVERLRGVLYRTTRDHCRERCRALLPLATADEPDWEALPGPTASIVIGEAAPWRVRASAFAGRHAPAFARRMVRRRRGRALRATLGAADTPAAALGQLADHVAVLRIAEYRLRSLPPAR